MKKPNFGWIFLRFEIFKTISKITNFQNCLEKPHRILWCCKTVHSKAFFPLPNCKMEKKLFTVFNPSNPLMVEVKYGGFGAQMGPFEPQKSPYFTPIMSEFDGLKTVKRLFLHFAIKQWKKPSECTVLQHQGTRWGFSTQFWKFVIFAIFW